MINPLILTTTSASGFIVLSNAANPPNIVISLSNKLFINEVFLYLHLFYISNNTIDN